MSFGENLQYLRSESDMTQEQLAERLEVSRQSVSKWESDASFPEMDKLLVLCDLFRCDLDTLLRKDAKAARQADTAGYDRHMNRFSKQITAGVMLCISGFSAASMLETFARDDRWSGVAFLVFVMIAVVLFIIGGLQHRDFCEHYARIEPFYDEKTLAAWRQRFPVFIAAGTALCIGAAIFMMLLDGISLGNLKGSASENIVNGAGLLLLALGVGLLVFGGMQNDKYHVETYNRQRADEKDPHYHRLWRIHAAIMLAATAAFLVYFYFWKLLLDPHVYGGIGFGAALIFGIGGLACGIVSSLYKKGR